MFDLMKQGKVSLGKVATVMRGSCKRNLQLDESRFPTQGATKPQKVFKNDVRYCNKQKIREIRDHKSQMSELPHKPPYEYSETFVDGSSAKN